MIQYLKITEIEKIICQTPNGEMAIPAYFKYLYLQNIIYEDEETGEIKTEEWRDVIGYEGLYQVSDLGRVKNILSKKIIKQFLSEKGYPILSLIDEFKKQKTFQVHRLVGKMFIENLQNKEQINHENGIKFCNCKWNLNWSTNGENGRHARRTGLCKQIGETASSAKLTAKQVLEIFNSDLKQEDLCKIYNRDSCCISNIKTGRKWSSVTGKKYESKKITQEKVLAIFNSNKSVKEIMKDFSVKNWIVLEIRSGKRWGWLTGKIKGKKND